MDAPAPETTREPRPLTAGEFEQLRGLAYEKFGLDLRQGKEHLVAARLGKIIRENKLGSFQDFLHYVREDSTGQALISMINALTTNHTSFFRERAHFDFLKCVVLPALRGRQRLDLWSAACSSGEEPYSIAFFLLEHAGWLPRIRILATDISTRALEQAAGGVYPAERLANVPAAMVRNFLLRGEGSAAGFYRVKPRVRELVEFRRANLIEPPPKIGPFPVIFCRNVMIYFDKPTQERVANGLAQCLEPGGWLLVGHAESLSGVRHELEYVQPAVYRKPAAGERSRRNK